MIDSRSWHKGRFSIVISIVALTLFCLDIVLSGGNLFASAFSVHMVRTTTLFGLYLATESFSVLRRSDNKQRPSEVYSWTFLFALILVNPSPLFVMGIAIAKVFIELIARRSVGTAIFSGASLMISLSFGELILRVFRVIPEAVPSLALDRVDLFTVVFAGLFIAVFHGVLRSIYWSNSRDSSWILGLRSETFDTTVYDLVLIMLGVLVTTFVLSGLESLPLAGVIGFAISIGASLSIEAKRSRGLDSLTNLPNRWAFERQIERYVLEASRRHGRFGVLLIDLDDFGELNDKLGSAAGDATLRAMAGRLDGTKRPSDLVSRLSDDTFGFLAFEIKSDGDIKAVAERLRALISLDLDVDGFPVVLRGTIGAAIFPDHAGTAFELLRMADVALYRAKQSNSGVGIYAGNGERFNGGRFSLLADLSAAIGSDQLHLVYQPKVDLATDRVTGVEALLRWDHPKLGSISPSQFMPFAEQTELMIPLTKWVLESALDQCSRWHAAGLRIGVSVNGSARNLHDFEFPAVVDSALRRFGVSPQWLEIEITESSVMADPGRSKAILENLRNLGVAVSVDDFGTGYSSFTYLKNLPISSVKIDSSFVTSMNVDESGHAIVRAIIDLARNLSLTTVAEGVETFDVMDSLRGLGCSMAQGFYISKPAIASEITSWIALDGANRKASSHLLE
ncbi:bifunctional diguanylate cyclase/phosphodiesterase [Acidithrix sp. C25]|uniref:putative bifunctional diguanylate cyclase/phosphodiesterase n=1 Tax=Acidithrix sp. C25 TaxID=1671482 RepID=UPI00191BB698|nr:bifunctional diguanylate cyclase/phosphodiesterase [Acidithrix sp. C25]CAG4924738.1 unnamed protein product [Acidithrix sp. C25]